MLVHFHFHLDGSAVYIIDKKNSAPSSKARKTNEVAKRDWGRRRKRREKAAALSFRVSLFCHVCVCQRNVIFQPRSQGW